MLDCRRGTVKSRTSRALARLRDPEAKVSAHYMVEEDGRIFRLAEHVERLYRSLRYLRIDIGLEPKEVVAISEEVVQRNEPLRAAAGDWWLAQRVSRGVDAIGDEGWAHTGPQVIVDCTPLPLKARATLFRDGIDVVVPSIRRTPPSTLSPRAKTHNYMNVTLGDLEAGLVHQAQCHLGLVAAEERLQTADRLAVPARLVGRTERRQQPPTRAQPDGDPPEQRTQLLARHVVEDVEGDHRIE